MTTIPKLRYLRTVYIHDVPHRMLPVIKSIMRVKRPSSTSTSTSTSGLNVLSRDHLSLDLTLPSSGLRPAELSDLLYYVHAQLNQCKHLCALRRVAGIQIPGDVRLTWSSHPAGDGGGDDEAIRTTVCCIGTWKRKKVATSFRGSLDVVEAYEAYEMACIS
jgi:hypothetical protein